MYIVVQCLLFFIINVSACCHVAHYFIYIYIYTIFVVLFYFSNNISTLNHGFTTVFTSFWCDYAWLSFCPHVCTIVMGIRLYGVNINNMKT